MKRFIFVLLCFMSVLTSFSRDFTAPDGNVFTIIDVDARVCELKVTPYNTSSFVIPSHASDVINTGEHVYWTTYKVIRIGDNAFRGKDKLTEVSIPNTITEIGDCSFENCKNLRKVQIPDSVTVIGEAAFTDCSSLETITLPASLTTIGRSAFRNCQKLTSIKIPKAVTYVGPNSFYNCSSLESIELPESDKETIIGAYAFYNCSKLKEIVLPNSVSQIGDYAFSHCSHLESAYMSNSVKIIEQGVFEWCQSLSSVYLGTIEIIRASALKDCRNLKSVYIPRTVKYIGNEAFRNCNTLTGIQIPRSVTYVGNWAFAGCGALKDIVIEGPITKIEDFTFLQCGALLQMALPSSIKSIGAGAFQSCIRLPYIDLPDSLIEIGHGAFSCCRSLQKVAVHNQLSIIGKSAFNECAKLDSIYLPPALTSIGENAFEGCSSLCAVSYLASQPIEAHPNTFDEVTYSNATLYASTVGLPKFQTTAPWKQFKTRVETEVKATEIILSNHEIELYLGESIKLEATILPEETANKDLIWRVATQNREIATVDQTGCIIGIYPGTTTVSVRSANSSASAFCIVKVLPREVGISELKLNHSVWAATVGDKLQLETTILPEYATDKNVVWSSDNIEVASVDATGCIMAVGLGETMIKVSSAVNPEIYTTCQVSVAPPYIKKIIIEPGEWKGTVGEGFQLNAHTEPPMNYDGGIIWSADNPEICRVDDKGYVTAQNIGSTKIRARSAFYPDIYAECEIVIPDFAVSAITLNTTSMEMTIGDIVQLTAIVEPGVVIDKSVEWTSSNKFIAEVDDNGVVRAFGKGSAVITATCRGVSAKCVVTVMAPIAVEEISGVPEEWECYEGESLWLEIYVLPHNATDHELIFTTENPEIVDIETNNSRAVLYTRVTALRPGQTVFRFTSVSNPEVFAECRVKVKHNNIPVDYVTLSTDGWTGEVGDRVGLEATVVPEDATYKALTWTSSNPEVAAVDDDGVVTALNQGETMIRVYLTNNPEIYAECHVMVKPRYIEAEFVQLVTDVWTSEVGDSFRLDTSVYPEDATYKALTWTSSNPEVAAVDDDGVVTALNQGDTMIRVYLTNNPEIYAECRVTVREKYIPAELIWNQTFKCAVGDTVELTAYTTDGTPVVYESLYWWQGGFQKAEIDEIDGEWYAAFPYEGPYVIRVIAGGLSVEKRFNVVSTHENLYEVEGVYYRPTVDRTAWKIVKGYRMYEGDYHLPGTLEGLPVVAIEDYAFYCCESLGAVVIEEGIQSIGVQAFVASSLKSISLPSSMTIFGAYALSTLVGTIKTVYSYSITPPQIDETTFNGTVRYDECVLHVPEGSTATYKEACIWEHFTNIVDDLPNLGYILIEGGDRSISLGDSQDLSVEIASNLEGYEILWTSSDDSIVKVSEEGTITGLAEGTAVITVSAGQVSDSIVVTIDTIDGIFITNIGRVSMMVIDHEIIVKGIEAGSVINLINVDSGLCRQLVSDSTEVRITVWTPGVYLVKADGRIFKVIV